VIRWQGQQALHPGAGLLVLFVACGVGNLLPHLPALILLRDGGAALYAALALWAAGTGVLWRRARRLPPGAADAGLLAA
jgi:hypothetical protein